MSAAQAKGFVVGKKYELKHLVDGEVHHKFALGDVVVFDCDDGSESPKFRRLSDNEYAYVNLRRLVEAEPAKPVEPTDFHVSLNPNSTTIVIQKRLSMDELAAVLKVIDN